MILRLQAAFAADTTFPRDRCVITPHFQSATSIVDATSLCSDLATALAAWSSGTREVTVTAYDAEGTAPVYPIGTAVVDVGGAPASVVPREVACCLSYYADRNIPRRRGRLYIPWCVTGGTASVRPGAGQQSMVGDLVPILAGLGGVDIDWVVYSRSDHAAHTVTNWWVDDEWDTIRSRGLRPTTRLAGTTSG